MTENRFAMISEWMVKGNISSFVKVEMNADRLGLVCVPFKTLASGFTNGRLITVA